MKNFLFTKQAQEIMNDYNEAHEKWIMSNLDQYNIDLDVVNQHTVFGKFWCWLVYRHLYKNGVCARCGKVQKHNIGKDNIFEIID